MQMNGRNSEVDEVPKRKAPVKKAGNKPIVKRKPPTVSSIIQESQAEAASPIVAPKASSSNPLRTVLWANDE